MSTLKPYRSDLGLDEATHLAYLNQFKRDNLIKSPKHNKLCMSKRLRKTIKWILPITFIYLQLSVTLPNIRTLKSIVWCDATCMIWRGDDAKDSLPKNTPFEVHLIISSCGGEDMDAYTNYMNNEAKDDTNIVVKSTTIISGCPITSRENLPNHVNIFQSHSKYPVIHFMEWYTALVEAAATQELKTENTNAHGELTFLPNYYQENGFIVFLNGNSVPSGERHTLDEILQLTIETGLGCVQRLPDKRSSYHEPRILKSFRSLSVPLKEERPYDNLGAWLDHLNASSILDDQYISVCYGSSFALKSRDLLINAELYYPKILAMVNDFKAPNQTQQPELLEFMERSLAAIFTSNKKLTQDKIHMLRTHSSGVDTRTAMHGSLIRNRNQLLVKFFYGDSLEREETQLPENLTLSLVISHCNEDMAWMEQYLINNYEMKNVTIYSKCNVAINGYYPPGSVIKQLPNVGRCDHTYAHWMANNLKEEDATDNHLVIFLKASRDNRFHHGMVYRPMQDMIRIAVEHGFACGYEPNVGYYHHTPKLQSYAVGNYKGQNIKSPYKYMGLWQKSLQIGFPTPIAPVCYGGNFVVKASQIYAKRSTLKNMELSLTRGNSIEEGHFAERTWAGLLSYPLNSNQTNALRSIPHHLSGQREAVVGSLLLQDV